MSWFKKILGTTPPPPQPATPSDPTLVTDARLTEVYGAQSPFFYGALVAFEDGGPDPLSGVSIYWNQQGPHWHYVGFGMEDTGIVHTFRLGARHEDVGTEPARFMGAIAYNAPKWPISMLNMLARRVRRTGRDFAEGHWWQGPPGVLRPHANFEHLAFARDPTLGTAGPLRFLQAVAVTPEVVESMKQDELGGRGDATLAELTRDNPLLVTRLELFP